MIDVKLCTDKLIVEECYKKVIDDSCGCVNLFVGTVRERNNNKIVKSLEFEAYKPMAIKEMENIAHQAKELWSVKNILIYHRIGRLRVGDIPVVIAAAATHRREAIKASHFIIDTLKHTVPIWKKEYYDDGSQWINPHP